MPKDKSVFHSGRFSFSVFSLYALCFLFVFIAFCDDVESKTGEIGK